MRRSRPGSPSRSTRRSRGSRNMPASGWAIATTRCWYPCAPGARESMPGMLDTVLNLGLNDESVVGLATRTSNERFAWDSYRRLVQMFGNVVRGVPGERLEDEIARVKRERGVTLDTELDAAALRELTERFRALYDFPERPARAASSRRSTPSLTPGRATGRSPTGASTASPTNGARPSTSSRWSTATSARRPARAWHSVATS